MWQLPLRRYFWIHICRNRQRSFLTMFKKIITFILLIAFAIHSFNSAVIVFGFYANQSRIAATLCENRDRPVLKCNGTCQLAKKLKQQEKKEQQFPGQKGENKQEDLSSRSWYTSLVPVMVTGHAPFYGKGPEGKPVHRSFAVFHPPIAAVHFS